MPVTVVPTSLATSSIETFMTDVSSVIRNWPAASVSRTIWLPVLTADAAALAVPEALMRSDHRPYPAADEIAAEGDAEPSAHVPAVAVQPAVEAGDLRLSPLWGDEVPDEWDLDEREHDHVETEHQEHRDGLAVVSQADRLEPHD